MKPGVIFQGFEWYLPSDAQHWKKLADLAPALAKAGFTAIWLPPAYKGASGMNDVGYGVYDLYDCGEFNQKGTVPTKYGTKEDYLSCIRAFQKEGIEVYADIVFNQKMGADGTEDIQAVPVDFNDRNKVIGNEAMIEAWTRFDFPGRKDQYSSFHWNHTHFDGVDYDQRSQLNEIYRLNGYQWDNRVDHEKDNYDYLMGADVCVGNPEVKQELATWGQWYVDQTQVDGFRLDALKHIDNAFFESWLTPLRQKNAKEFFAVGEYWSADVQTLNHYLEQCHGCLSLFDVPLHYNFFQACNTGGNFDMGSIFNGSLVQSNPEKAVTFVMNHDTQCGQALQSAILDWFKPLCYALILLRPQGYPCVFYGDYFGIPHSNQPGHAKEIDVMMHLRQMAMVGSQHDYFDHHDVIGWTFEGDEGSANSGFAVLLTDGPEGEKKMAMGKRNAGKVFVDALDHCPAEVTLDENGDGIFKVQGGSLSIWVPKKG